MRLIQFRIPDSIAKEYDRWLNDRGLTKQAHLSGEVKKTIGFDVFDFELEDLNQKQKMAFKHLSTLREFQNDAIAGNDITKRWLRWDKLDRSIDFIEGWGIDHIEEPSRKFTVEDLDNIYEFLLEDSEIE